MLQVLSGACGRAVQMNLGAGQAHGTFLIFLHADSQLPEGYVGKHPIYLDSPSGQSSGFTAH